MKTIKILKNICIAMVLLSTSYLVVRVFMVDPVLGAVCVLYLGVIGFFVALPFSEY